MFVGGLIVSQLGGTQINPFNSSGVGTCALRTLTGKTTSKNIKVQMFLSSLHLKAWVHCTQLSDTLYILIANHRRQGRPILFTAIDDDD